MKWYILLQCFSFSLPLLSNVFCNFSKLFPTYWMKVAICQNISLLKFLLCIFLATIIKQLWQNKSIIESCNASQHCKSSSIHKLSSVGEIKRIANDYFDDPKLCRHLHIFLYSFHETRDNNSFKERKQYPFTKQRVHHFFTSDHYEMMKEKKKEEINFNY